jgi:hypothetical protein
MATANDGWVGCAAAAGTCLSHSADLSLALLVAFAAAVLVIELAAPRVLDRAIARFREWRAVRLAARRVGGAPLPRDRTAALISAAADNAFAGLRAEAQGKERGASPAGACADESTEADWLAFIAPRGAARPSKPMPAPVAHLLDGADRALREGAIDKAVESVQRVTVFLCQRAFKKAAVIYACEMTLRADAAAASRPLVAELARRSLALSEDFGCQPAQAVSALLLARIALHTEDFTTARNMIARALAAQGEAPAMQIAVADVNADFNARIGNFERARALLGERVECERSRGRAPRDFRAANAHFLADLARVEMAEALHAPGWRTRRSGRRAAKFLRESLTTFQRERDVCSLSLTYTRLAMAAVMQRHLNEARTLAQQGRKFAEEMQSADLISSADDLVRRIEMQRSGQRVLPLGARASA